MKPLYWVLEGHTPVPTNDHEAWARMFGDGQGRVVAQEKVETYYVSTVFLGIDHNYFPTGDPVLFETMVFGEGDLVPDNWMARYCTWDEAEAGHKAIVYKIENQLEEPE